MLDETASADANYELILTRLRDELGRSGAPTQELQKGDGEAFAQRRSDAERLWAVSAERPFLYRPGPWGRIRGLALSPLKAGLRKLMRWYVEPLAVDQRRFNAAVLMLVDALSERGDAARAGLERKLRATAGTFRAEVIAASGETASRVAELEERLTRAERRERASLRLPSSPAAAPHVRQADAEAVPDYFAYESRMRGSTADIAEKQRVYVEDFRGAGPVLDLGCGRGEFLSLLREANIEARGVDADPDMVAYATGEGLDVALGDVVEHLESLKDGSLGGIFGAQLVEHLPAARLVRLLEVAAAKLRPGGLLVAETINPLSPLALRNYYADLTHSQPLVPETLELLAKQAGFARVETRFLNEPEEKLVEPDDPTIAANVRRLNELVFAPLDYAILART
jgi:SAM-dependent methyltransferase